jgi:hypothetical protein
MIRISTRRGGVKLAALSLLVPATVLALAPVAQAAPTNTAPLGTQIFDQAVLPGLPQNAGGTVQFQLYAGTPTFSCTNVATTNPVFMDVENLGSPNSNAAFTNLGGWTVNSTGYTPLVAETYYWVVTYTPDNSNNANAIVSPCGAESTTVTPATTTITTTPQPQGA